jgi:glycine oxidase
VAKHLLVIGAGAFGLFCARAAIECGWRVSVIDKRQSPAQAGAGCASASAAGMLGPLSETLLEPADANPALLPLGLEALALWGRLGPGLFGPAYQLSGALHVGSRTQAAQLLALATRAREAGLDVQVRRGGGVRAAWPGLGFAASIAVQIRAEALVQPVSALGQLEKVIGAACRFGIHLDGLGRERGVWRAQLSDGATIDADEVLICAGFSPAMFDLAPSLKALQPVTGVIAAMRAPVPLQTVVRGPGFYLAPRGGHEVVLGSSMQFGVIDLKPDVKEVRKLAARLFTFAPTMKSATEVARWAGVRAMSPDWAPLIGRDPATGVLVAAGAGRNGWLLAPLVGEVITALLQDRPVPALWAKLNPSRFSSATPPSPA